MKRLLPSLLLILVSLYSIAQTVPFPSPEGRNYNAIEPYGYQQVGTTWDTSPYLPFIYRGMWFRMMLPNGVTYNRTTKTFTFSEPGRKYPVILFFHGRGEGGTDNNKQLVHGGQIHRDAVLANRFQGFLVYPQSIGHVGAKDIMDKLLTDLPIDISRIYVHGLSNGGAQTWNFTISYPQLVAASFPMSASDDRAKTENLLYMPIRQSQGGLDTNPDPDWTQTIVDWFSANGGHHEYFFLPTAGHGTWNQMYTRSDFFSWFLSKKKNQIYVRYKRNEVCPTDPVNVVMGFTPGFDDYEWRKDGAALPNRTFKITATSFGSYTGRYLYRGVWSEWADPVVVGTKAPTQTPPIQLASGQSRIMPDVQGNYAVTMTLPAGYENYTYFKQGVSESIALTQTYTATTPGSYYATVKEFNGCSSIPSPNFVLIDGNAGTPKPDAPQNLTIAPVGRTELRLTWENTTPPTVNETGFEIWRASEENGPFSLITTTAADASTYSDRNLPEDSWFYYRIRSITSNAASVPSPTVGAKTESDVTPPSAPSALNVTSISTTAIGLSWSASTDDVGVAGYDVFVRKSTDANYIKAYSTTSTSITVFSLTPYTLYNFIIRARDASENLSQPSPTLIIPTVFSGVNFQYYHGAWTTMPNFSSLTPVRTGTMPNFSIGIPSRPQNDNFGIRFTGTIFIPTTGQYTFFLTSKDGSKMFVNNQLVVDHDGVHASSEKNGRITLNAGYYPIEVQYFETTGTGERLEVRWQGPNIGKATIPNINLREAFNQPAEPAAPVTPVLTVLDYRSIRVSWGTYAGTATQIEVYRSTNNSTWTMLATVPVANGSHTDLPLNPSTRYFYRLRAINSSNVSAFTASSNATTLALPPLPVAPSQLRFSDVAVRSATIAWTDNSTNEESFELFKSAGNNTTWTKVATLPPNTTQYIDNALSPHALYYYRVQSRNVRGASPWSNEVSFTTLNTAPEFTSVAPVLMRFDEEKSVAIRATDTDGDALFIGGNNLPAFAQIYDYGEGNGELYLTPTEADQGTYALELFVQDLFGGSKIIPVNITINDNHAPQVAAIAPVTVSESYVVNVSTSATDEDNDVITWTLDPAPQFILPTIDGNNIALKIAPSPSDQGTYAIKLRATDAQGAFGETVLNITVNDFNPNFRVLVNFTRGSSGASLGGSSWNNITSTATGPTALRREDTSLSGITMDKVHGWGGTSDNGGLATTTASVGMPSPVTSSFFFHQSTTPVALEFTGLNPDGKYNMKIYSGRLDDGATVNRETIFTINGTQVRVNATGNTSVTADFNALSPDATGKITLNVSRFQQSGGFAILNGIILESFYDGNIPPAAPTNLAAALDASSNIRLTWTDVAYNEQSYQVHRSSDGTNFTLLTTLPANATSFVDNTFASGITYSYRVRGVNAIGSSPFSNTVSILGPNKAPVIKPLSRLVISEMDMQSILVEATDPENDTLDLYIENEPYFVSYVFYEHGRIYIQVAPPEGTSGDYSFNIVCDDRKGGRTVMPFTMTVKTIGEFLVRVNFTNTTNAPAGWNNFTAGTVANGTLSSLRNDNGEVTPISIVSTTAFSGVSGTGGFTTGNNSGIFPDAVTGSYFWISDNTARPLVISGLKPDKQYDFTFFSSRQVAETDVRNTVFAIGTRSVTLNGTQNANRTVQLTNVKAPGGTVTVNVSRQAGSAFAYLNAIIIREYADAGLPTPPAAPANLTSQVLTRSAIRLAWQDGAENETGFEIWRSVGTSTDFELLTTVGANTTTFTNTALSTNTRYVYKVRAVNATGTSAFSNEVSSSTFDFSISINFNSFRGNEAGWNNLPTYLRTGQVVNNLTDELGVNTGISMTIVDEFDGDNPYGMNTGNNSGAVPDRVMEGSWWIDRANPAVLRFNNMSFLRNYNFTFFASRAATGDRNTVFIINGRQVTLNASMNTGNTVQIQNVTPDPNGTITITITTTNTALFGYLNGLVIQAIPVSSPNGRMGLSDNENFTEEAPAFVEAPTTVYPNPFDDKLVVEVGTEFEGPVMASLISSSGVVLEVVKGEVEGSNRTLVMNAGADLSAGVYILQVAGKDGRKRTFKVMRR